MDDGARLPTPATWWRVGLERRCLVTKQSAMESKYSLGVETATLFDLKRISYSLSALSFTRSAMLRTDPALAAPLQSLPCQSDHPAELCMWQRLHGLAALAPQSP